jgi:hypothetical protein
LPSDEQFATFAFDDDGTPAEKSYVIRNGILERPLGGAHEARVRLAVEQEERRLDLQHACVVDEDDQRRDEHGDRRS